MAQKLGVEPASLIFGNGSNEIIEFVGHALMRPGVDIVASRYCFAIYPIITHLFGANLVTVPAKNYRHDLPAMLNAITPRSSVIFVANPNNPTGTVASPSDFKRLIDEIPDQVLLVIDEAYLEFLTEPVDFLPLIRVGKIRNLLLLRTFSKIFGLAGLRLGYGIGHPELIANLEKVRQPFNVNALVQAAALAALDDQTHITRTRANNATGLEFLQNSFRQLRLEYVPSSANFVMVRVGDGQRVFQDLQEQGIIIRPMTSYQLPEWIRVSVGTPEEMQRFVLALKRILN
jgi:histidinol-phosphate aminotransferase